MKKYYVCPWCQNEFSRIVIYSQSAINPFTHFPGKKSNLSTQVKCSKCLNFIPTWNYYRDENGKKIRLERRG